MFSELFAELFEFDFLGNSLLVLSSKVDFLGIFVLKLYEFILSHSDNLL